MADDAIYDNSREDFLETLPPYTAIEKNTIQENIGGGAAGAKPDTFLPSPQVDPTILDKEVMAQDRVVRIQDELKLEKFINLLGTYEDSDVLAPVKMMQRKDDTSDKVDEITIIGVSHDIYDENIKKIATDITINPSDLYFVEVNPAQLPRVFEYKSAEEAKVMGESAYIAWLAHQQGKHVRSWDLPFVYQLEKGLKKLGPEGLEPILGSVVGQGLIHILNRENEDPVQRAENVINLIRDGLGQNVIDFFVRNGIPVSPDKVSEIIRKYSGKEVNTLSKVEVSELFRPDGKGLVNKANAACNELRDEHAITEIYKAKSSGDTSKITVVAGIDHTRLWRRSLECMYPIEVSNIE